VRLKMRMALFLTSVSLFHLIKIKIKIFPYAAFLKKLMAGPFPEGD
jgi:hypothetical protein